LDGTTILIADDNSFIRTLVRAALRPLGCDVVEATDGEEAVRAAHEHDPAIILLDVVMPNLDGFGALEALRSAEHGFTGPIVMLTTAATKADFDHGEQSGADAYIVKPFEKDELRDTVQRLLEDRDSRP
jgi:CheY-like chemotaxis protein